MNQILAIGRTKYCRLHPIIPELHGWEATVPTYFKARNVDEANSGLKKSRQVNTSNFDESIAKFFGASPSRAPAVKAPVTQSSGPHASAGCSLSRKSERRFGR
jgi:hypothetical protein